MQLKEYLKQYRLSAKEMNKELKNDPHMKKYLVSFQTDFCQYLCGYYFGIINLAQPILKPNYYYLYGLNIVLNNIIQNKNFDNPFVQIPNDTKNISENLKPEILTIIDTLQLNDFINQVQNILVYLANIINENQQHPIDFDLLINNIVTWTIYMLINDKLKNSEIENISIVDLWTEKLTILTSYLTEQLKQILGVNFGLILEYICNLVLAL